jgi:hypothetical protein
VVEQEINNQIIETINLLSKGFFDIVD